MAESSISSASAPTDDHEEPRHPIGVVARRTGLKPDLIRAWERRYSAVEPARSDTRRRFYSDNDIKRLRLLRDATQEGRAISQVASLSDDELVALIAEDQAERAESRDDSNGHGSAADIQPVLDDQEAAETSQQIFRASMAAVRRLDSRDLEKQLERGSVALSRVHLLQQVLVPLMHSIGDQWQAGSIRPVHEHMASSVVRSFVGNMRGAIQDAGAPHLIATTPARQHHELGALIVAATAASEGWNVTYLGPDLPAEEIAAAVQQKSARVLALSITYPPDDPLLPEELQRLHRLLGSRVTMLVGGRSADAYRTVLQEIGAEQVEEISVLRTLLAQLRSENAPARLDAPEVDASEFDASETQASSATED